MPEGTIQLAYEKSTHAPVRKQYRGGVFETVGDGPEPGKPWRIDPETGAEIHALGGPNHRYSTDEKVGSSYPATTFIFADGADGEPLNHEELEEFLRENDLWRDALAPVMVTQSVTGGPHLKPGLQFRPPDQQPYSLDKVAERIEEKFDLGEHEMLSGPNGFRAYIGE